MYSVHTARSVLQIKKAGHAGGAGSVKEPREKQTATADAGHRAAMLFSVLSVFLNTS